MTQRIKKKYSEINIKTCRTIKGLGNPRGNENPFLLTFGIMWFRYHNYLAMKIRESPGHENWSDERVYNEARIKNIAVHQVCFTIFIFLSNIKEKNLIFVYLTVF